MVILGIDASSKCTGWAIVNSEDQSLIAFGEIQLSSYKKKKAPLEFLLVLYNGIINLCQMYKPDRVYIEDIYALNMLTMKTLARVRGVVEIACLHQGQTKIMEVKSSHLRKVVLGKGNLEKQEICSILEKRYSVPIATDEFDQSDAIMVALCGAMKEQELLCHSNVKKPQTMKNSKKPS